ncbi:MAG: PHP domain-containing protein [Candidatus Falkowbacteria bacterium]
MKKIDLHLHSSLSDGDFEFAKVIDLAREKKLGVISITDHNTWFCLHKKASLAKKIGVEFIQGIEISAMHEGVELHILGYAGKFDGDVLKRGLEKTLAGYRERMRQITANLVKCGFYNLNFSNILKSKPTRACLTKHDIVMELTKRSGFRYGEAKKTVEEQSVACGNWALTPFEAVRLIEKAGGLAVLAHGGETIIKFEKKYGKRKGGKIFFGLIDLLIRRKLRGLECFSTKNNRPMTEKLLAIAGKNGLAVTGGSDWHGPVHHPEIPLGGNWLPEKHYAALKDAIKNR